MTDKFHAHEALHACQMVGMTFDQFVLDAEFVQCNEDLKKQAESVSEQIGALYQSIGAADDMGEE